MKENAGEITSENDGTLLLVVEITMSRRMMPFATTIVQFCCVVLDNLEIIGGKRWRFHDLRTYITQFYHDKIIQYPYVAK